MPYGDNLDRLLRSIAQVEAVAARIDERVKLLVERARDSDERLETAVEAVQQLVVKVSVLESRERVEMPDLDPIMTRLRTVDEKLWLLENHDKTTSERYTTIFAFTWQIFTSVMTAYLLYRMGFPH